MATSESLIICTAQKRPLPSPHPAQCCEQSEPEHLKHNSQLCKIISHGPILMNTRLYFDRSPAPRPQCGLCPRAMRRPGGRGAAPRTGCAAFVSQCHGGLGGPAAPPQVLFATPGPAGTAPASAGTALGRHLGRGQGRPGAGGAGRTGR